MEEIKVFEEREVLGKEFKMYGTVDTPLFLARDVAELIDYAKTGKGSYDVSRMLNTVDEDEYLVRKVFVSGQKRDMKFLTEDGLYEVLMQSTKPIAKQFKKEVKAILKQLRLTGAAFVEGREEEAIEKYFPSFSDEVKKAMVLDLHRTNKELKAKISEDKPLVDFANSIAESSTSIDMNTMSKLLKDEGVKIGRNKLFDLLRENKILMKNNQPYQTFIDRGYFEVVEYTYQTPYGLKTAIKTLVTGKGQIWLVEKLKEISK